jgi:hypothetical protein
VANLALVGEPIMPTPLAEVLGVRVEAVKMMLLRLAKQGLVERVEAGWRLKSGSGASSDTVVPIRWLRALGSNTHSNS